jgi:hypothetical protein
MVALYQISTNTVIQNYGNTIPETIYLSTGDAIHCPDVNWISKNGDYKFIPVVENNVSPNSWSVLDAASEKVVNNELIITVTYRDPPLVDIQEDLCTQVDVKAEEIRLKYITPGAGQMGIYIMKYQEALQIVANTDALPADYPLNGASIGLSKVATLQDAAKETLIQSQLWVAVGATVEKIRLSGKAEINAANTILDALTAFNNVSWAAFETPKVYK